MALDQFFHNKIESMKLEIIQGQAVLRRLEAQRNDYNSRGEQVASSFCSDLLTVLSAFTERRARLITAAWFVRW